MKMNPLLLVFAACFVSLSAVAQWQWIDASGRKVFSDRPPGAEVPEKNIIKQPSTRIKINADDANASAVPAATKSSEGIDKGLMEKKKQADAAEAAKRKTDEDRVASAKADNCNRARQAKVGLDSGTRISRINDKGEREFLDDSARAAESQRNQSTIDSDCR
jgi:Domain of unknown function (DUF4124)